MKKSMERYFNGATTFNALRIAALLVVIVGVLLIAIGHRSIRTVGAVTGIVGLALFFIFDSRIIKDKSYDDYMLNLLSEGDGDAYYENVETKFECYTGQNAKLRKVKAGVVRTDRFVRTQLCFEDKLLRVIIDTVALDGSRDHIDERFPLSHIKVATSEEDAVNYVIINNNDGVEQVRFPAPRNNYTVEQFSERVNNYKARV